MSYSLEVRQDALSDIEEAAEWYEKQEPGLGIDFARTVLAAIETLPRNPLMHRLLHRGQNVRRLLTNRFPYRVIYQIRGEIITVFAVLHSARHSRQWKRRIRETDSL